MSATLYKDQYSSFINAIAKKRKEVGLWTAIVIHVNNQDDKKTIPLEEIVQVLEFEFNGYEIFILVNKIKGKVFVIIRNNAKTALALIEKTIQKTFMNDNIKVDSGVPLDKGLDYLCKQLGECVPPDDHPAIINLKRLSRPTNCFLLITDNTQIKEGITRLLQSYGQVVTVNKKEDFYTHYSKFAPNAVFIDTSYIETQNSDLASTLKSKYDSYAYIIGIGENSITQNILKYKSKGIDGYIIWPANFASILRYLVRIPTIVMNNKVNYKQG